MIKMSNIMASLVDRIEGLQAKVLEFENYEVESFFNTKVQTVPISQPIVPLGFRSLNDEILLDIVNPTSTTDFTFAIPNTPI